MGKIPKKDEDPIDNLLNDVSDRVSPAFKSIKFTPNGITTLSMISELVSLWGLYTGRIWVFAIMYFIGYYFDTFDGYFARRYKMTSKFGDFYDHIKDTIVTILLIVVIIYRFKNRCSTRVVIFAVIVAVFFLWSASAFVGCQSKVYKSDSDTLKFHRKLCPGNPKKAMKWLRYLGPGVYKIVIILLIIVMELKLCPKV